MDQPDRWNALVSLATLGTARVTPSHEQHWPVEALATHDAAPGITLLRAAAASNLWQLAGARAQVKARAAHAAPALASAVASEAAASRLGHMLAGERRELVAEWFEHAVRAGAVLPPHWLPAVLEALEASERRAYARGLGPHAVWLAAQEPEWSIGVVAAEPSDDLWISGTFEERVAALRAMRGVDPARARAWLERTWDEDPAEARAAFIATFATDLSAADEPLLERALDDRRKAVRAAAADCLARLPDSAHARRNIERLRPLLTWHAQRGGLLGKLTSPKLEIELPAALDKAAVRDGIEPKPPAQRKIGERAYWLVQMIAFASPRFWTETFQTDVEKLVDAALKTDYGLDLLQAFTEAALRHPSEEDWLRVLCERSIARHAQDDRGRLTQNLIDLVTAAPATSRDRLLHRILASLEPTQLDIALALLAKVDARWSSDVTKSACELLANAAHRDSQQWSHPRTILAAWGVHADVGSASQALPALFAKLAEDSPWRNAVDHLIDTIRFRTDMKKELAP